MLSEKASMQLFAATWRAGPDETANTDVVAIAI
jgi:hypothetical protein